jgi:hypothetical protein
MQSSLARKPHQYTPIPTGRGLPRTLSNYLGLSNWQHPHEIIAYHHHMGEEYEIVGSNIMDVWKTDYARYDEIDQ